MNNIQWKTIPFEDMYEVSSTGEVRNRQTLHIKSQRYDRYGYKRVTLYPSNKTYTIHRLVMLVFFDVIAEQIADLMMREEVEVPAVLVEEYKEVPVFEANPEEVTELQNAKSEADEDEEEFEIEDVIRVESKGEDITIIKEALQGKEAKSFQPYIKHLKAEVPEAILNAVDSTLVSDMIEARIAEVKAQQEKTK